MLIHWFICCLSTNAMRKGEKKKREENGAGNRIGYAVQRRFLVLKMKPRGEGRRDGRKENLKAEDLLAKSVDKGWIDVCRLRTRC